MCHTEHVFHRPCCHWGRERFVGEPCIRSRLVNGRYTGCSYRESLGSTNSNDYCCDCKYRQAKGGYWRPFADISNGGWAQIEKKAKQRASSSEYSLIQEVGRRLSWFGQNVRSWLPSRYRREGPEQHFRGFGTGELPSPVHEVQRCYLRNAVRGPCSILRILYTPSFHFALPMRGILIVIL